MKTVLLAYEREQDLAAVESVLQSRGHRVIKARTGLEALEAIRAEPTPDAVVSDVLLPRLDGFALCRRLREDPAYLHLPFVLHSFRVEGPKYEAFAAEVGAVRFLPRGSTLDEVAAALDESGPQGSGTLRMPALVPGLLDQREQDRRRLMELEKQVRELEGKNQQIEAAERVARDRAEYEARARSEFAASESARIRELMTRIKDLETAQREAREAAEAARQEAEAAKQQVEAAREQAGALETQAREAAEAAARGVVEESRAEIARLAGLESRLIELQTARARAQAAAGDAERVFAAQLLPTFVVDVESRLVHVASDSAARLVGLEPATLRGKPFAEVLRGAGFADDAVAESVVAWQRPDGTATWLELRRAGTSYAGRTCWLVTARDVSAEQASREREQVLETEALALAAAPAACGIVDEEGRFRYGNRALLQWLAVDAGQLAEVSLRSLEATEQEDATVRTAALGIAGPYRRELRWRRPDGVCRDVEVAVDGCADDGRLRVVTVRDVTDARLAAQRDEREQQRASALLELAQRAHGLTENEILEQALQLAQELTDSPHACLFLPLGDAPNVELVARRGRDAEDPALSLLARWRGVPPHSTALYECLASLQPVVREAGEELGALRQAGLPPTFARQALTPMLDGGRLAGVLLVADAGRPYDDADRRHLAQVAEATWKLLRRRRSDAEVVSAMDHMERVMLGAIEALAQLAESQDACKVGRAKRVGDYAAGIGSSLGLPGHMVRGLRVMGQLVDVGMLQIPRELLWRPGTLAPSEYELVKTHVERGYETLRGIEFPWPVADVVRQHHERLDGSGYPRGLRGEDILLEARIVAVADAVEAMLASRPHRAALTVGACIDELQAQAGRRYDARVVKACVKLLRESPQSPVPATLIEEGESPAGQRIA